MSPAAAPRARPAPRASRPPFLALLLLALICASAPTRAEVRLPDGEYYATVEDLSVKVMGGYVSASRSWFRNRWYFNSAWAPLTFTYDSLDGSVKAIERAGWRYDRSDAGVFVFDARNLIRATATGYRWQDRAGNFIDYDAHGRIQAYGDRNAVTLRFRYEGEHISGALDPSGNQVLWYERAGAELRAVRDATGRRVEYRYSGGRLSEVIDVLGESWRYQYNGTGRLSVLTDPEGRERRVDYGANGRVAKLTAPDGSFTQYGYDYDSARREVYVKIVHPGGARVEERWYDLRASLRRHDVNGRTLLQLAADGRTRIRTDENGAQVRDTLDEWDNLVRRVNPDGTEQRFEYEPLFGNLVREVDERGVATVYDYDARGNLIRTTEAAGLPEARVTELSVDAYGNVIRARRLADAQTPESLFEYAYDTQGNFVRLTDPEGAQTTYAHNALGQVIEVTDGRAARWTSAYDAAGQLTAETDPLGNTDRYAYDRVGNPVSHTNPRGVVTRFEYDALDRLIRTVDALDQAESQTYSPEGQVIEAVDRDARAQRFEYDALGRVRRHSDAAGTATVLEYSDPGGGEPAAFGPTRIVYPTFENQLKYDKRSRVVLDTDVDGDEGFVRRYRYDARGQVDAVTDSAGHTTFYEYDALGRLTKVTDRLGFAVAYTYDNRDNLVAVTDPQGGVYRMVYDHANRLVEERRPDGQVSRYAYDATGNLLEVTQAGGGRIAYTYDAAGRLTEAQTFAAAAGEAQSTTTFGYDAQSNLITWSDGTSSASFTYDVLDRKTNETLDYGPFSLTHGYGYTPGGLKAHLSYPDGASVAYSYDPQGEVQSVEVPGEGPITVNAWRWRAPEKITLPGGSVQDYDYDGRLQLTALKVTNPAQQVVVALENRFGRLQEVSEQTLDAARTDYLYDAEGRLVQVKQGERTETYTLDAVGNRIAQGSMGGAWRYDSANRLLQQGSTTYAYSPDGSRTEKNEGGRITRYVYDVQQRLVRVEDGAGSTIARYGYDPFDRRLWKEAGGARTYFLYADEGLIGEYAADGSPLTTYGYLPDGPFSTDVLFVRAGGQTFYAHNDQLGTTLKLTDRTGRLVWSAEHDAFGRASLAASNTVTFNPRLPGQYFDAETGLHYNFRRAYDPDTGRYLTEDPIGLEGGINLYAYVNGDPVNNIDPTGEIFAHAAVFAGCFAVCMLANGIMDYANGDCQDAPWDAKDCALTCIPFPVFKWAWAAAPKVWKWAKKWWPPCKWAPNSFPGETLVHTKDGLKPIRDIQVGDEVLAWAEWKDEYAYKPVTHIFTGEKEYELVRITLDNGEVIEATAEHPLYVSGEGWRAAGAIEAGTQLDLRGNGGVTVALVDRDKRTDRVYNLEIRDSHTYSIGNAAILAHNPTPNRGGPPHGTAKPHGGSVHNRTIDRFVDRLYKWTSATNIRKNQTQVPQGSNVALDRNRPDVQFDYKGRHYNYEWDNDPAASTRHRSRIRLNDPASVIRCKIL